MRLRQLDAAEQALAVARATVLAAADALGAAEEQWRDAQVRAQGAWATAEGMASAQWHWNWIARLERGVEDAREVLELRRIDERRAAEIAREARKQVKVLERLKERAYRAWQLEARRAEQKAIDELAGLRFASRLRAAHEETR